MISHIGVNVSGWKMGRCFDPAHCTDVHLNA